MTVTLQASGLTALAASAALVAIVRREGNGSDGS